MNLDHYIVDTKVPIEENYNQMRSESIAFIEQICGVNWSNLNDSDPGITILDQICFALTELGYCGSFSIPDILTDRLGKLQFENQFYAPEKILTSSAITPTDLAKYLVDRIKPVKNSFLTPTAAGIYQPYLFLSPDAENTGLSNTAKVELSKVRNLGEQFAKPILLSPKRVFIKGTIEITQSVSSKEVADKLQTTLRDFIFPYLDQKGFKQLNDDQVTTETIFNGPLLKNGWISDTYKKVNSVSYQQLQEQILSLESIESILSLSLVDSKGMPINPPKEADGSLKDVALQTTESEIIVFEVLKSIELKHLTIAKNGKKQELNDSTLFDSDLEALDALESINAALKIAPDLPSGEYRDIEDYYSIQNTLPDAYNVGPNSLEHNASEFETAQSRQLKGYLTLFDQVLANQFSQLANIHNSLSFVNSQFGDTKDHHKYYATKTPAELSHPEFPVPYRKFSPTYYFQSLYNVPHIKPLLIDNEMYQFNNEDINDRELKEKGWLDFQNDPYNPYILGISEIIESEQDAISRRDEILDHLLARHGVSPLMIDRAIQYAIWTSDSIKDQVIVKSLILQNFDKISYHLGKGWDILNCNKLSPLDLKISNSNDEESTSDAVIEKLLTPSFDLYSDGLIDTGKIDKINKLKDRDFVNFSALELTLNLLFGLNNIFDRYDEILNVEIKKQEAFKMPGAADLVRMQQQKRVANWLIKQRKGFLLIEHQLLLQSSKFKVGVKYKDSSYYVTDSTLDYNKLAQLFADPEISTTQDGSAISSINELTLSTSESSDWNNAEFIKINDKISLCAREVSINSNAQFITDPYFSNRISIAFPWFVMHEKVLADADAFKENFSATIRAWLPAHIEFDLVFLRKSEMYELIMKYVAWHNSIRSDEQSTSNNALLLNGSIERLITNHQEEKNDS